MLTLTLLIVTLLIVWLAPKAYPQDRHKPWPMPKRWHAPKPWLYEALCLHDGLLRDNRGRVRYRVGSGEGAWNANTGNGYYGGLQFLLSTWQRAGGSGYPHQFSPREQLYRARVIWLSHRGSWSEWGHMRIVCELR